MSILTRPEQAVDDVVAVEDLPTDDVLDAAELMCCHCTSEQPLSEMYFDFEDEQFVCATCAQMLLDGTMYNDDVPCDIDSCADELSEDDLESEGDF